MFPQTPSLRAGYGHKARLTQNRHNKTLHRPATEETEKRAYKSVQSDDMCVRLDTLLGGLLRQASKENLKEVLNTTSLIIYRSSTFTTTALGRVMASME